jgi:hypothetical protein
LTDAYGRHKWECDLGTGTITTLTTPMILTPVITGNEWFDTSQSTVTVLDFLHNNDTWSNHTREWQVNCNAMMNCGSAGMEIDAIVTVWATEVSSQMLLDLYFPPWSLGRFVCRPWAGCQWIYHYDNGNTIICSVVNNFINIAAHTGFNCDTGGGYNAWYPQFYKYFSSIVALQQGCVFDVYELGGLTHIANIHCSVSWEIVS